MSEPQLVRNAPLAAWLGQFLNGVGDPDVLTELLQNEFDYGATHTTIEFAPNALIVEGNGRSVDAAGWLRLAQVMGAGQSAPAKEGMIGIKNHGLRACFLLGDEIHVRSAAQRTCLFSCDPRGPRRLDPATWDAPIPDAAAPRRGCRVEVPYRTRPLPGGGGDLPLLLPFDATRADAMLEHALENLPVRFLGVIRPRSCTRWLIELRHWQRGTWKLCLEVVRSGGRAAAVRSASFRRRCVARGPDGATLSRVEEVWPFEIQPVAGVPRPHSMFVRQGRWVCDVSWLLERGQPRAEAGRLRYPISLPLHAAGTSSRCGVHFCAPFQTAQDRQGLAAGWSSQNTLLLEACRRAFIEALRSHLSLRYGPPALGLLQSRELIDPAALASLACAAAHAGALVIAPARSSRTSRGPRSRRRKWSLARPGQSVTVPAIQGQREDSPELGAVLPRGLAALHPATPPAIRQALLDAKACTRFDEFALVDLLTPGAPESEPEFSGDARDRARLTRPRFLRDVLDLLQRGHPGAPRELRQRLKHLWLPGADGQVVLAEGCRLSSVPVPIVPGVAAPRLVHPALADHPVLKILRLRAFDLDEHVSEASALGWSDAQRGEFFRWLLEQGCVLRPSTLRILADEPVWPTRADGYRPFAGLCRVPERLARILEPHVTLPRADLASWLSRLAAPLPLRTAVLPSEMQAWFRQVSEPSPELGALADADEARQCKAVEAQLTLLLRDAASRNSLQPLLPQLRTIAKDGRVRRTSELHLETPAVRKLRLRPCDLLRGKSSELYQHARAHEQPTREAIVRALREDVQGPRLTWSRLRALEATKDGEESLAELGHVPIFRIDGRLRAPIQLCLPARQRGRGRERGYWGSWKVPLTEPHLTPAQAQLARRLGVTEQVPTPGSAREYFRFLASRPELLEKEERTILRHWQPGMKGSPETWWQQFPEVPCLLTIGKSGRRLVTHRQAVQPPTLVFLGDFPELQDAVLEQDDQVNLAVVDAVGLRGLLEKAGVRSFRGYAGAPAQVTPRGAGETLAELQVVLNQLRATGMRAELKQRLQQVGADPQHLKPHWHAEMAAVRFVRSAAELRATWQLRKRSYGIPCPAALDDKGVLWLSASAASAEEAFFHELARLLFRAGAPHHYRNVLGAALRVTMVARWSRKGDRSSAPQEELLPSHDVEPIEARPVHGRREPDPARNLPDGAPIPRRRFDSKRMKPPRIAHLAQRQRNNARPFNALEEQQRVALTENHYAQHCQICLATSEPSRLAPPGSYVQHAEYRAAVMVAHHNDHVREHGARDAGNLLILCTLHHAQQGDHLAWQDIRRALRKGGVPTERTFSGGAKATSLQGLVIQVSSSSKESLVAIFFTPGHRDMWLELTTLC